MSVGMRILALLSLAVAVTSRAAEAPVMVGLSAGDAEKHNVEYQQYGRMAPVYREHGIQPALFELGDLYRSNVPEDRLLASLKRFHAIMVTNQQEGVEAFDESFQARAKVVAGALARYVEDGGGLLWTPQPVRYTNTEDELYWNAVFATFGVQILHEGVFDKTRQYQGRTLREATFFWTANIADHPVTEGVGSLYLPLHGYGPFPGVPAMQYSADWTVVASGGPDAKSYKSGLDNCIDLDIEGTYSTAPPVAAVRTFGKGRVACYPVASLFLGMNYKNPLWADTVEEKGDPDAGRPSDSMTLQMNLLNWLAEPARDLADYGTYELVPYKPVEYPRSVQWDDRQFGAAPASDIRGIFGAHTAYSDGAGTVADYVAAARAAGLSFIVFADPLEKLTKEKLEQLKADCAAASDDTFYACPGIEFTDGPGLRWTFWGEGVVWPRDMVTKRPRDYPQWTGERVNFYGSYAELCRFPGSALIDYQQMAEVGTHPENMWWFYHYLPFVYDGGKLIADNFDAYLFGLRDIRWAAVASFTRIRAPREVAAAAATCFTGMNNLANAKKALNTRCAAWGPARAAGQYVSQGPTIAQWDGINGQLETNWKTTRGGQRVRLRFVVRAADGIAEVLVLDDNRGPIRRFAGNGATELARDFEIVGDQQHHLVLDVRDTKGRRAVSTDILVFSYKGDLFRCGDNLNILGPTAMCWHPDRNEDLPIAKDFRNGAKYALRGWDTASASLGVPSPVVHPNSMIRLAEVKGQWYPHTYTLGSMPGRQMRIGVNSHNMQIVTMRSSMLAERFDTETRPTPALGSLPRDVAENEYFETTRTMYAPMERINMYTTWNYRRAREGLKDYRGAILWHEGEIRFKKDCTLAGDVPIPLFNAMCPTDLERELGEVYIVTDADGSTQVGIVRDEKNPLRHSGRIRPGGYAAVMTTPLGYHGLLVPADSDFAYHVELPSRYVLTAGPGHDGQQIKAGDVIKYRFGIGTFADEVAGSALLEDTARALNMAGGHDGYPVEMAAGEIEDATFFFTAKAAANEAAFTLGPRDLIIDLPIRVRGLADNGCVALYSSAHPWFRFVPVDDAGTAWFQEPVDAANDMWVGNVFVADNPEVKLTLVVDGQADGVPPFLEVHNPTVQALTATVHSPAHAPLFGGQTHKVAVPAGDSVRLELAPNP